MKYRPHRLALLVLCAAVLLPATARAQWYAGNRTQPAPLYPYELQPNQPYAVEVAPGTYVIHRPQATHYPYVRCPNGCRPHKRAVHHVARRAPPPRKFVPRHKRNDPALIEELRRREAKRGNKRGTKHSAPHKATDDVINTRKIVREPPVVIVHRRVVQDPPRVIERRHYVEDAPPVVETPPPRGLLRQGPKHRSGRVVIGDGTRVIHADAEITILGPDRMSIRLVRKGSGATGALDKK